MPRLPLLPVWEKGDGGMRGQTRLKSSPTSTLSCTIVNNIEIVHRAIPADRPMSKRALIIGVNRPQNDPTFAPLRSAER
jgi:hypothetical protein